MASDNQYRAHDIDVLEGLEPVRRRPGVYTHTENPLHIVQEVIDNAADEALAGYATRIDVRLLADGGIEVEDDGRGIPVDKHPEKKIPAIELAFTHLHAGSKFRKGAYRFSGGLHGVGVSVTNALCRSLEAWVWRKRRQYHIAFVHGEVAEPLSWKHSAQAHSGTRVRFYPDSRYFDTPDLPVADLERLLRAKAVLLPGVTVTLTRPDGATQSWRYENGLADYLAELTEGRNALFEPLVLDRHRDNGEGALVALTWLEEPGQGESYVNLIPTPQGGTHVLGLRSAVVEAVRRFVQQHQLLPRGVRLQPEDVFGNVAFVLSARVAEPQFAGQTKERLSSRDATRMLADLLTEPLEVWLNEHVEAGRAVAELAIRAAERRQRAASRMNRKTGSRLSILPGKLVDCASPDPSRRELFLVEGDSAGGSAKECRDRETQAILPLKGKIANTWELDDKALFGNTEVRDIAIALGIDPHDPGDSVDLTPLRYHRIIVLADADVDGAHIQVLLLTLFFRHFPRLVERGHVYIAQPPLYRIDAGKGKKACRHYVADANALQRMLKKLARRYRENEIQVARFKGLGEMDPDQLWETTMNPATRKILQVSVTDRRETAGLIEDLMARHKAGRRRQLLAEFGNEVMVAA